MAFFVGVLVESNSARAKRSCIMASIGKRHAQEGETLRRRFRVGSLAGRRKFSYGSIRGANRQGVLHGNTQEGETLRRRFRVGSLAGRRKFSYGSIHALFYQPF